MRAIFTHNIYYHTPKRELAFCGISKNAFLHYGYSTLRVRVYYTAISLRCKVVEEKKNAVTASFFVRYYVLTKNLRQNDEIPFGYFPRKIYL